MQLCCHSRHARSLDCVWRLLSVLSIIAAFIYLILKLTNWCMFLAGSIPVLLAALVLGLMQLFFIGLLGEYILNMNQRLINRPLAIEEERLNF